MGRKWIILDDDLLIKLYNEGKSADEIGNELWRTTEAITDRIRHIRKTRPGELIPKSAYSTLIKTGRTLTEEHKQNIGIGLKKAYSEGKRTPVMLKGNKNPMFGKHGKEHPKYTTGIRKLKERSYDRVFVRNCRELKKLYPFCRICGRAQEELPANQWLTCAHLEHNIPEKIDNSIENLIVLCPKCHYEIDNPTQENIDNLGVI